MRKQFNLEYYLEHPDTKVVTRCGNSARILCTDLKSKFPIVSAITYNDGRERIKDHCINGKVLTGESELDDDLLFDLPNPEKKRVPLTYEDLLERVKTGKTMWISALSGSYMKYIIGCNKHCVDTLSSILRPLVEKFEYQELMASSFIDGDPCWKEEEDEI